MAIKYAILGMLSWQPRSGYDIKKFFSDSTIFYWSGNNNQIYNTLLQLLKEGLVSNELYHQENLPNKKVYSISEKGLEELKKWVAARPDPPELRNKFLIQLAWAEQLSDQEVMMLLESYEEEVQAQLLMHREKLRRGLETPKRIPRESYLWNKIAENISAAYENEVRWARQTRHELEEKKESWVL